MKTKKILYVLIAIVIIVLGYALFKKFYDPKDNNQLSDKQVASLVKKVSKLIAVPDEKPVVATILKADELIAEQKFYAGSQNGDYLIVFPTAQKALIYREKENKLINVGPIIVDQNKQNSPSTSNPASTTEQSSTSTKSEKGN